MIPALATTEVLPSTFSLKNIYNYIIQEHSLKKMSVSTELKLYLFIYLGFYVAFNTVQVISRRVVGRAEESST